MPLYTIIVNQKYITKGFKAA